MQSITEVNGHDNQPLELVDIKQMELEMLRQFYLAWVGMHSLPRDNRDAMEQAAQYLMECAHVVKEFRKGKLQ